MTLPDPSRRRLRLSGLVALAALVACDLPTAPPKWDTEWEVPADSTRLAVSELLPSSVTVTPGGTAFSLSIAPVSFSKTLGEMCGTPCTAANGQSVPKPAINYSFSSTVALPADVASAALSAGRVDVRLSHDFSFDPLRPPGTTSTGTITARVLHGTTVLGSTAISGATTPFPAGTALTRSVTLTPTTLTGPLTVEIQVASPAGGSGSPVLIDTSDRISVAATPAAIEITEAAVVVQNQTVSVEQVQFDMSDIDSFIRERAKGGALILKIENPFAVAGTLNLSFSTTPAITRAVQVQPGNNTVRVSFSADEVQRLLGSSVSFNASGTLSATGATVTVTPTQVLVLRSRLELTLGAKEK